MSQSLPPRPATHADAPALCRLMAQLGYAAALTEFVPRVVRILDNPMHAIWVAERDGMVIGLAHVARIPALDASNSAELFALIVDEAHRGAGAGARLLAASEQWASAASCDRMVVRSNIVRTRTPTFYEQRGYKRTKTQLYFRKPLK